jgi:hypothetical protein
VLAAATPESDDDIAAAIDNDSLQSPAVHVEVRAELQNVIPSYLPQIVATALARPMADVATVLPASLADHSAAALYLFMSLLR